MPSGKRTIVLASRNEDKIREMKQLCANLPFEVASALDFKGLPDVIEDGTTALGNAGRKALVVAAFTGQIAVADDTTLQVRVLGGWPDVFASRFAGLEATYADNVDLLLDLLRDVPDGMRQARFTTSAVWIDPRPQESGCETVRLTGEARSRWLHNPFARAIHLHDAEEEAQFWNQFVDRQKVWRDYRTTRTEVLVTHGVDPDRLAALFDRLLAPFLGGGRPEGSPADAVFLPDTRIWTADGPEDNEPLTVVTPLGLPPTAPGRSLCEPVWLEISAEGRLLGEIGRQPLGWQGFGYDPIFRVPDEGLTLAELDPQRKNEISHRGRALRRLLAASRDVYQVKV